MRTLECASAAANGGGRRLLVVDQFEECFTLCRDEAERAAFVAAIVGAAEGDAAVVVAVRADFYARCAAYCGGRSSCRRSGPGCASSPSSSTGC